MAPDRRSSIISLPVQINDWSPNTRFIQSFTLHDCFQVSQGALVFFSLGISWLFDTVCKHHFIQQISYSSATCFLFCNLDSCFCSFVFPFFICFVVHFSIFMGYCFEISIPDIFLGLPVFFPFISSTFCLHTTFFTKHTGSKSTSLPPSVLDCWILSFQDFPLL